MKNSKSLVRMLSIHKQSKKRVFLASIVLLIMGNTTYAQSESGFGIKAGLNYNGNGDYFESIEASAKSPDRNVGYHVGFFGKIGEDIYFRPELVYTNTKSSYDNDDFIMKKIDAPLLVGFKVIGPLSVFAGPSLQYIVDSEFEGITINDVDNDFTVGLNFGVGVNFKKFGVDLRYERGFNDNEATFINNNVSTDIFSRIETRPEQLILSVSLMF